MARKNYTNYIQNMVSQHGENWIIALKPEDIQRSAKRIFREMIRGQIDYQRDGKYFLDLKFLDNLIIAADNELEVNTLYFNSVFLYRQFYPNDPLAGPQISHLYALCNVYKTLHDKLSLVKHTSNIGWMADISTVLFNYRNHLN